MLKEIQHATKRVSHVVEIPSLVELQLDSYKWFLEEGLHELFESFSPIRDFQGKTEIYLEDFTIGEPKYSVEECRDRDMTFEAPIKASISVVHSNDERVRSEVYLGDLPLMTDKGTFVINGAERVVVSQLARSPGVYFEDDISYSGRFLYHAKIIPQEGAWIEVEADDDCKVTLRIGQLKKIPLTTLLRALNEFAPARLPLRMPISAAINSALIYSKPNLVDGSPDKGPVASGFLTRVFAEAVADSKTGEVLASAGTAATQARLTELAAKLGDSHEVVVETPSVTTLDIVRAFGQKAKLTEVTPEALTGVRLAQDVTDAKGKVIARAYQALDRTSATAISELGLDSVDIIQLSPYVAATLAIDINNEPDPGKNDDEAYRTSVITQALLDIQKTVRPSEPSTYESARTLILGTFYDPRRYDTAKVGRFKINKKLEQTLPLSARTLCREDLVGILRYIINLNAGKGTKDDIDHLENKRVRSVGELLASQLRMGFMRMEKVARERMASADAENVSAQTVLSVKPISASIKSFFGSSQLSQFMDQTNPLAEITAKRKLSALGPGGLSRQSAKLEVRDVHHSHYGRICPIETPEGPNIGLIGSLAVHARVDEYGFIETPYRKVNGGVVTGDIVWMTADEDFRYHIAPANLKLDEHGRFEEGEVQVRFEDAYPVVSRSKVEYMDVAPVQLISIATAMIPFIENDEATRALMGANMQRQAVPTLRPTAPIVKTGMERRTARDSGAMILARRSGVVKRVTADQIDVLTEDGKIDNYRLINLLRSNNSTCITQRPVVNNGQRVRQGQVLTDGPCTDHGELALGQNVLVAFMPWGGYNFEDAILLSERLVKDDVFTSIHIEEFDREARDTKLGPEEITRDIPNVGEEMLKDLDEDGIVRIGAEVHPEDILLGEVAPKGQGELTAEERLIIAIFGKKAEETRDVSLRVPHGNGGRVVDVKVFSRFKYQGSRDRRIYNFCKKATDGEQDSSGGDLLRLQADELNPGVNMMVRVYLAQKRKIMEGDKMAGRHGNKGVVSKILPTEDMPFLPDGTPVDIVLNPLGVPSRMNIGQVLETHLGYVGHHLNCTFVSPAFEGSTESEIRGEMWRLAEHFRKSVLENYVNSELRLDMRFSSGAATGDMLLQIGERLQSLNPEALEAVSRIVGGPPVPIPQPAEDGAPAGPMGPDYDVSAIVERIKENAWARASYDPLTGKTRLVDGLTGEFFDMPVTVGIIYMLKLAHLVDDKIHARSTGPYSLVTQQPLGGKAQFGGQRFGEMEVWALEAYGAAYTLQEILTIKSDDVQGRVKTYESIVKGDSILEPGVPESFKILVNELQSLALKVTVLDAADNPIDLRDHDDDLDRHGDPVKNLTRQRSRGLKMESDDVL
ncbi:MAG: DNA-directed RNA polymerase subunit beta [Armatimonadetes bacterium]|nr:DNA-directed RNA polymerase subunit beta [Armatimonadota bacterium]MDE2205203.1 DNA-directed RNA polymerase subunit beta [Armatimonadota bacterium]